MTVNTVPVVDISALMSFATDVEVDAALGDLDNEIVRQMVEEFHAAATEWGFFYITNHGLPDQEIDRFRTAMQSFFRLPRDMKHSIRRHVTNSRGYFDDELTKNKMDWKECFDFAGIKEDGSMDDKHERLGDDENLWLDEKELPGFHQEMIQYYNKMEFLSRRLLKVFAVALGETPAFFDQFFHGDNSSFLRLNHYPLAPESDKIMGVYQHTDAGALTVLLQDDNVASLQVFHRDLQTWMLVPPRIGTFTINIGDMLQVWSNDKFVAPLHRVLAKKDADRLSAPFFYNPSYKAEVKPIVAKEGEKPSYRPLSWREFRLARFQGDYADKGKEIQIDDFKIHGPNL